MLRRSIFSLSPVPTNHLGQRFPPGVAAVLQKSADANKYTSAVWVTPAVLASYAQSVDAGLGDVAPTMVDIYRRSQPFYNAEQVDFYLPKGIGFVYRADRAKEMVLAAKLYGFKSSFWCSARSIANRGLIAKPDQQPIIINNVPFYNGDQVENGDAALGAADERVQRHPSQPFRSVAGKRYNAEMCADLSEFLTNNKIMNPGSVWGTAKAFKKYGLTITSRAVPFQIVSEDGVVYDLYNGVHTSEPLVAEQLGQLSSTQAI